MLVAATHDRKKKYNVKTLVFFWIGKGFLRAADLFNEATFGSLSRLELDDKEAAA